MLKFSLYASYGVWHLSLPKCTYVQLVHMVLMCFGTRPPVGVVGQLWAEGHKAGFGFEGRSHKLCVISQNCRITGLGGTLKPIQGFKFHLPCHRQGSPPPAPAVQGPIQPGLGHLLDGARTALWTGSARTSLLTKYFLLIPNLNLSSFSLKLSPPSSISIRPCKSLHMRFYKLIMRHSGTHSIPIFLCGCPQSHIHADKQ